MIPRNPVLEEGYALLAASDRTRDVYRGFLIVAALLLLLFWPSATFVRHFTSLDAPVSFRVLLVLLPPAFAVISGIFGLERVAGEEFVTVKEWIERVGIRRWTLLWSKTVIGVVHTVALFLLVSPIVVVSAVPVALVYERAPYVLCVMLTSALAARFFGLFALVTFRQRRSVGRTLFWVLMLAFFGLTIRFWPEASPVAALFYEGGADQWYARMSPWYRSWMTPVFHLGISVLTFGLAACVILLPRSGRGHGTR
jgi:hypothetical protein